MKRLLAGSLLLVVAIAACDSGLQIPSGATPVPGGAQPVEAAGWAAAMCQAVDQLEQAIGDPTTGQRSAAWREFETQLTGADEERLKAAANGVLGHLTEGSRQASSVTGFEPGAGAASEMEMLLENLAMGVRTLRDATLEASPERVNEGRRSIDAAIEQHYEQALGQMAQVPLGPVPMPCVGG
ncbi:MAG TPA: hypothetical protein VFU17_05840 [Candidatus Limnocylindrales bacterium]|nr:hypothetical protein [Candidatus Limnocylindrales bacterium]